MRNKRRPPADQKSRCRTKHRSPATSGDRPPTRRSVACRLTCRRRYWGTYGIGHRGPGSSLATVCFASLCTALACSWSSVAPPERRNRPGLRSPSMAPTIYENMGGADTLLALAEAWHRRCLADPILAHPFEGGIHPEHTQRLAAYWSEQLGGPGSYSNSLGSYSHVVRLHSGNGPHEQMDGRAVAAFVAALDDVGISTEPRLRFQLIAWFTWATAVLNHRWTSPDDVPSDLPLPLWSWEGTEGW